MGSRGYFRLIAILLLLVVAAAIAFALFAGEGSPQPWMYGVAQLIVIAVAVLLIVLYRKTIKPLNTLTGGIDLIKEQGFSFPVLYDVNQDAAMKYGVSSLPTTYFINKDGNIVTGAMGAISKTNLLRGIEMIQ